MGRKRRRRRGKEKRAARIWMFVRGFVRGILVCMVVLALGLFFCERSGLMDFTGRKADREQKHSGLSGGFLGEERLGLLEGEGGRETPENPIGGAGESQAGQWAAWENEGQAPGEEKEGVIPVKGSQDGGDEIRLLFAGDLLLTEVLQEKYARQGIGAAASEELLSLLQSADVFMVNQEFPFGVTGEAMEDKEYTFRVPPEYVSVLQELGIRVVTLANNHTLDFGRSPLSETLHTLDAAGILRVGAGENLEEASAPRMIEAGGKTIAFLGASRVIPVGSWNAGASQSGLFTTYDPALLVKKIQETRPNCDFLAVYVHWGVEYESMPEEYQRELARAYIDAGADAVIGSHPHVLQGIEYYQGKPIFYSLGNFIFSNGTYETMMAELTLDENGCRVRLIPLRSTGNQMSIREDGAGFFPQIESISFGVAIDGEGNVVP